MNDYIVGQVVETALLVLGALCFLIIIGGSLYDLWMARRQRTISAQYKRLRTNRPHITVLVYAHNSVETIAACLTSILKNRYRQYDIVVVNNRSTDATKQQLWLFQSTHPTARLRLYNKYKVSPVSVALRQAYVRSQRGEIVITLRAGSVVGKTFLKDSVAHATAMNRPVLLLHEQYEPPQGVVSLLWRFLQLSHQLTRKNLSFFKIGKVTTNQLEIVYERAAFLRTNVSTRIRYVYDSNLSVTMTRTPALLSLRTRQPIYAQWFYVCSVLAVLVVAYSIYAAITFQHMQLLITGWSVVVVWFFAAIWSDEGTSILEKLRLIFPLPSLYFIFTLTILTEMLIAFVWYVGRVVASRARHIADFYSSQPTLE